MKIILKVDVKNLGSKDDVVEVADGFAINLLIPQGKAVAATPKEIAKSQKEKETHHQDLKQEAKKWLKIKAELESKKFFTTIPCQDGMLIKNISRKSALEIINKDPLLKLEKNQLPSNFEFVLGNNLYPIELYPGIKTVVNIEIQEKK